MKTLKFLGIIGLLAILGAIGSAAFFFGGFFNIAANHPDPDIVNSALEHVRDAAIARHATDRPPASLDDPALIQAGARAYSQRGCVYCHGGPGADWAKFSEGLNPGPPDLKDVANELLPQEIFWVVRNGIKMTGMPSFAASDPPVPDQEIWSIAAFVKKLPSVSEDDYKAWTAAPPAAH
jgi:mono/diheme cytochrome c family protein